MVNIGNLSTEELSNALERTKDTLKSFLKKNEKEFLKKDVSVILNELLAEKGLSLKKVIKKSNLNPNYAYQIFNGQKSKPSRDKLIAICIGMNLTIRETQKVLKQCKVSPLYVRFKRDAIIMHCIKNKKDVISLNLELESNNQKLL